MLKFNSILFVSTDDSALIENVELFNSLNVANEVVVMNAIGNGIDYIKKYNESHFLHCPELILLNLKNTLSEGIDFLEAYSKLSVINRPHVHIVFLVSPDNQKDITALKVLGDFEFLYKPLTEEKLFNCLTEAIAFH
jgi:two-component SAPR family response regulator